MHVLIWIIVSGLAMSAIAFVGALTLALPRAVLRAILTPLVALAAESMIGGALFHMIPASVEQLGTTTTVDLLIGAGFVTFLAVEQFLNWHHSHSEVTNEKMPMTYLILIGDGVHNFVGGLFVSAGFLIDIRLGLTAWLVAAAHEIPQELGDFGVLVHGGWSTKSALVYNFLSGLTFLTGGVLTYFASQAIDASSANGPRRRSSISQFFPPAWDCCF